MICQDCRSKEALPDFELALCNTCRTERTRLAIPSEVIAGVLLSCIISSAAWYTFPACVRSTLLLYSSVSAVRSGDCRAASASIQQARQDFPDSKLLIAHLALSRACANDHKGAREALEQLGDEPMSNEAATVVRVVNRLLHKMGQPAPGPGAAVQ